MSHTLAIVGPATEPLNPHHERYLQALILEALIHSEPGQPLPCPPTRVARVRARLSRKQAARALRELRAAGVLWTDRRDPAHPVTTIQPPGYRSSLMLHSLAGLREYRTAAAILSAIVALTPFGLSALEVAYVDLGRYAGIATPAVIRRALVQLQDLDMIRWEPTDQPGHCRVLLPMLPLALVYLRPLDVETIGA